MYILPSTSVPHSNDSGDFSIWLEWFIIVNQRKRFIKSPIHLVYQKKEVALSLRISLIKEDARHVLSMSTNTNNLIITDYLCIHHRFFVYFNTKMSTSCLFRGWNILSIKWDKNSWNIIAHVYSPVKEVVVIDAQYTFRKWWWVSRLV